MVNRERVVVAMSGGVDSAVAAALLKEQGFEVIGITMCFKVGDSLGKRPSCCGIQGIEDARRIAHKLGIKHYVINLQDDLEDYVIKDFIHEYLKGRTPNPCVRCNQYLKFDVLLKKAISLGAEFLATGHYARIEQGHKDTRTQGHKYILKKAKDLKKDQSYFLYRLGQHQLKRILFPLGNYTKEKVRKLARDFALPVADKLASQEICFLPDNDYRGFLIHRLTQMKNSQMSTDIRPGRIIDKEGNILGRHQGIAFYTIGQRQGLGIARGYPIYITGIDAKNNSITVGRKEDVYGRHFLIKDPHFIFEPIKNKVALKVKIRYNHSEASANIMPFKDQIKVSFKKPQFAITPGQAAVFYNRDVVLGGGIIA